MSCPLCVAEHLTTWFHEDDIAYCCLCKSCGVPMVVLRQHNVKPTSEELDHMLKVLNKAARSYFGTQHYWIDRRRRQIPSHYHLHARRGKNDDLA